MCCVLTEHRARHGGIAGRRESRRDEGEHVREQTEGGEEGREVSAEAQEAQEVVDKTGRAGNDRPSGDSRAVNHDRQVNGSGGRRGDSFLGR